MILFVMGGGSGIVGIVFIFYCCGKYVWKILMVEFWLGLVL